MNTQTKLATLFATSALLLSSSVPSFAASAMTDAFVANVRPNVDFLDKSSRLAIDKSPSRAIRAYARGEAEDSTIAANSLVAWTQTNTVGGQAAALGTPVGGGPLGEVVALPLDVAGNVTADVTNGVGDVLTGRSVSIDTPLTVNRTPDPSTSPMLPSDREDMDRLSRLKGRQFDALYRSTQRDSLRQLATLYRDYSTTGDDPALRAMAVRDLPKINSRLAELRKL